MTIWANRIDDLPGTTSAAVATVSGCNTGGVKVEKTDTAVEWQLTLGEYELRSLERVVGEVIAAIDGEGVSHVDTPAPAPAPAAA